MRLTVWSTTLAVLLGSAVWAGDWPAFRGPEGSGVSDEVGLPVKWSKTENVRWKAELPGRGLASPVVVGNRVIVTASSGSQQDRLHVLCFDTKTGRKLWERQFKATGSTMTHPKTSVAAPTPVVDDGKIYALFSSGDLAALDLEGNLLWFRALQLDYPAVHNQLGMAASPIVVQGVLMLPLENAGDSFVAGVDVKDGVNRWKVERKRGINWVSPLVMKVGDRVDVLFQSGSDLTAYDPTTGKERWTYKGGLSTIPSPVPGKDIILAPGGGGLTALRAITGKDEPEVLWESKKLGSQTGSPLFYDGRVYAISSGQILQCADAINGEILWSQRVGVKPYSGSPVAGDGKIYCVNELGVCHVVKVGEKPELLASNDLGETILSTPAIAGGAIYLRSDAHLWCISDKGK